MTVDPDFWLQFAAQFIVWCLFWGCLYACVYAAGCRRYWQRHAVRVTGTLVRRRHLGRHVYHIYAYYLPAGTAHEGVDIDHIGIKDAQEDVALQAPVALYVLPDHLAVVRRADIPGYGLMLCFFGCVAVVVAGGIFYFFPLNAAMAASAGVTGFFFLMAVFGTGNWMQSVVKTMRMDEKRQLRVINDTARGWSEGISVSVPKASPLTTSSSTDVPAAGGAPYSPPDDRHGGGEDLVIAKLALVLALAALAGAFWQAEAYDPLAGLLAGRWDVAGALLLAGIFFLAVTAWISWRVANRAR